MIVTVDGKIIEPPTSYAFLSHTAYRICKRIVRFNEEKLLFRTCLSDGYLSNLPRIFCFSFWNVRENCRYRLQGN